MNAHVGAADDLAMALVARAIDAAPDHRPVLDLLAGLDLGDEHRRVLEALVAEGDRARPVQWRGPGPYDMSGGPVGTELVAERLGWEADRPYVLAPLVVDSGGAVVPLDVLVGWCRDELAKTELRTALIAAASSLETGADPHMVARRLADRLAEVPA